MQRQYGALTPLPSSHLKWELIWTENGHCYMCARWAENLSLLPLFTAYRLQTVSPTG